MKKEIDNDKVKWIRKTGDNMPPNFTSLIFIFCVITQICTCMAAVYLYLFNTKCEYTFLFSHLCNLIFHSGSIMCISIKTLRSWNVVHHATKLCIKKYCSSQAAGWHMHANCHVRIRSCFSKSAFVSNVLLLKHFRHFSVHSFFQPDLSNIFLMFKYRQLYYITRSCWKHVLHILRTFLNIITLTKCWRILFGCSCETNTFFVRRRAVVWFFGS